MRRIRARLSSPTQRAEAGFSLPELIVTMALMSVISILVVTLFSTFARSMTKDRSASESTNVAAIGMSELTRVLRSGTEIRRTGNADNIPVFLFAGRESLIMHGFLDTTASVPKPVKIQFAVNSSVFKVPSTFVITSVAKGASRMTSWP